MGVPQLKRGRERRSAASGLAVSSRARRRLRRGWAPLLLLAVIAPAAWAGDVPEARSLAPVDAELVRSSSGQEALFRLRLGVEAAQDDGAPCPVRPLLWSGSAEKQSLERQLRAGRPYAAGLILGAWQLRQLRCGAGSAPGGASGAPR